MLSGVVSLGLYVSNADMHSILYQVDIIDISLFSYATSMPKAVACTIISVDDSWFLI